MPPRSKKKTPTPKVVEENKIDPVDAQDDTAEAAKAEPSTPVKIEDGKLVDDTSDPVDPELNQVNDSDNPVDKELNDKSSIEELDSELVDKSEVPEMIEGINKSENTQIDLDVKTDGTVDYSYPIIVNLNSLLYSMKKYVIEELKKEFEIIPSYRNSNMTGPNDSELAFSTNANFIEMKSGFIKFIKSRSSSDELEVIRASFSTKFKRFDKNSDGKFIYY